MLRGSVLNNDPGADDLHSGGESNRTCQHTCFLLFSPLDLSSNFYNFLPLCFLLFYFMRKSPLKFHGDIKMVLSYLISKPLSCSYFTVVTFSTKVNILALFFEGLFGWLWVLCFALSWIFSRKKKISNFSS